MSHVYRILAKNGQIFFWQFGQPKVAKTAMAKNSQTAKCQHCLLAGYYKKKKKK